MNKYRAKKITADGITFDSLAEHSRYQDLKLMERAGEIGHFTVHPVFDLVVSGKLVCRYEADFDYTSYKYAETGSYRKVTEDVKGMRSGPAWTVFRIKAKLFEALMGRPVEVYPPALLKPRRRR